MNADGSEPRLLIPMTAGPVSEPCWSPDAQQIAFVQNAPHQNAERTIRVVNADGTSLHSLTATAHRSRNTP
jgi:Tol biopolymer transport system component